MRASWLTGAAFIAGMTLLSSGAQAQQVVSEGADVADNATTTGQLAPGGAVLGALEAAGDQDWYRVTLRAGRSYRITADGAGEAALSDPVLFVIGANPDEPLAFNDDAGGSLNSALTFTPATSGDYYLALRAYAENMTGGYRLAVSRGEAAPRARAEGADVSADTATRGRINAGQRVAGALDPAGDVDWYRINLQAGRVYHFTADGAGAAALADPVLLVMGAQGGDPIGGNDDAGGSLNSALDFTPTQSGVHYLGVRGYSETMTGGYVLAATRGVAAPAPVITGTIAPGASVSGALAQPGDSARYRIQLTGGETYRFSLDSSGETPLGDPWLNVLGAQGGEPLASNDDGGAGFNSYLEFTAPETGAYLLEARAFADGSAGGFTLSARAGDIPGDAQTDLTLSASGETRADRLAPAGDTDWFRIELTANQTIRVQMVSNTFDPAPLSDPLVAVHDASGEAIAFDDDGGAGLNAYLEFTAPAAGTYFINARGFQSNAAGAYALTVRDGDIPGSAETDEELGPDDIRTSRIGAAGDADWFVVNLIEGRTYRFQAMGVASGDELANPMLALHAPDGGEVARDDDGGPGPIPALTYIAPRSGAFRLAVTASGGRDTGAYAVRMLDREVPGDFATDEPLTGGDDSRESRIDFPGDQDAFLLAVTAGQTYTVRAAARGPHGLANPTLTVASPAGGEIGRNDDESRRSRNAALTFVAPAETDSVVVFVSGAAGGVGDYVVTANATQ